ncbi:MAG: DUF559 domain-containing protein [Actinomycetia bacterium]|nr:DUF559 domain-containing protein [Actinomycetes bacterium]
MRVDEAFCRASVGGLATARALTSAGVSRSAVARAVREGRLRRISRGLYGRDDGIDEAARLAQVGVLSHTTAAARWGMDLLSPPGEHVTVPRDHSRPRRHASAVVHRVDLRTAEVTTASGLPTTTPLRTVLDCARVLDLRAAVVVADSALRLGLVGLRRLQVAAAAARGPGSARVRRMAALVDPLSGSALETLLRLLLTAAGIRLDAQVVLSDRHGVIGRVDFVVRGTTVVIEADGFAYHRDRAEYRADRRRTNALLAAGYLVLRFSWEDVVGRPQHVVDTVRQTLAVAGRAA